MGVERAVTRWYVQRQVILGEITLLENRLASASEKEVSTDTHLSTEDMGSERANLLTELAVAQERLRLLGHCPKPMMG